jgi:hypothetical protein
MDARDWADQLMEEFNMCCRARPSNNTVDVQIAKDTAAGWAYNLGTQRSWGTDADIAEACRRLEPILQHLKEKIIIEVLTHGIQERS